MGQAYDYQLFLAPPDELETELRWFDGQRAIEEQALGDLPRLELVYERDLESPAAHETTADRVFEWIGLPSVKVEARLQKLLPQRLDEVVANAAALETWLRGSEWAHLASPGE